MPDTTNEKLRILLQNAGAELRGAVENYGTLISQLELLERSLASGDLNDAVLESTRNAFPLKLKPSRSADPASAGMIETRRLLVELNHLVDLRRQGESDRRR